MSESNSPAMHAEARTWAATQRVLAEIKRARNLASVPLIDDQVDEMPVEHLAGERATMIRDAASTVLWVEAIDRRLAGEASPAATVAGEAWAPVDLTPFIDRLRAGGIDVNVQRVEAERVVRSVDCRECEGPSEVTDSAPVPADHKLLRLACGHLARA